MEQDLRQIIARIESTKAKAKELGDKNKLLLDELAEASAVLERAREEAAKLVEENRKALRIWESRVAGGG
jgi:hypothetical protein